MVRELNSLWCDLLSIEQCSLEEDFLFLGGDSLFATALLTNIQSKWGVGLSYKLLFENRTLGALASLLEKYQETALDADFSPSDESDKSQKYWQQQLTGLPAVHGLLLDHPRSGSPIAACNVIESNLDIETCRELIVLCGANGATLFMGLHAAFSAFLSIYSNEVDVVLGIVSAKQLVLRSSLCGDHSFIDLISNSKIIVLDACTYSNISYQQAVDIVDVEQSDFYNPLYQIKLGLFNNKNNADCRLIEKESFLNDSGKCDLVLLINKHGDDLRLVWQYNPTIFDDVTIDRMAKGFNDLLTSLIKSPSHSISNIDILADTDRQKLSEWNYTQKSFPSECCFHELFEHQVEKSPEAAAIISDEKNTSYRELNQQANRLANYLVQERCVIPETRIGVCVDRSHEMLVALLAILKAGGAYVPLDPDFPQARLAYMLENSQLSIVLASVSLKDFLHVAPECGVFINEPDFTQRLLNYPDSNPNPRALGLESRNLAYVIYTSGSTGQPKGVMIEHRSLVNQILWRHEEYGASSADRILHKTPLNFDVSVWEFAWPLICGASIVLAKPGGHKDPYYLADLIKKQKITKAHFVPSMLSGMLITEQLSDCFSLKQIFCSGEALPVKSVKAVFEQCPQVELHNLYGPTEATIDVSTWDCANLEHDRVMIGRPIYNVQLYVLNNHLHQVPIGVSGELFIGGSCLARGYLNRPGLTAERFIPNPYYDGTPHSSDRLYRTGDLVRFHIDGNLEYLGRLDHQVKIRGIRIELGEIEAILLAHPNVREVVVVASEIATDAQSLVAYLVADAITEVELRSHLKKLLPEYMIPSIFLILDVMPLTPSGKIDRKALPDPLEYKAYPDVRAGDEVADILSKHLEINAIKCEKGFYSSGGDSIKAQLILVDLRKAGYQVGIEKILSMKSVKSFCTSLDKTQNSTAENKIIIDNPFEVTSLQKKMLFQSLIARSKEVNVEQLVVRLYDYNFAKVLNVLNQLLVIHPMLKAGVSFDGDGMYMDLSVHPTVDFKECEAGIDFCLDDMVLKDAKDGFCISGGALFRVRAFKHPNNNADIVFSFHHAITDGWSMNVFIRDFSSFYAGNNIEGPLNKNYAYYIALLNLQKKDKAIQSQRFWKSHLGRVSLDMLTLSPLLNELKGEGGMGKITKNLPASIVANAHAHSSRHNLSLNSIFQYAWACTIAELEATDCVAFTQGVSIRPSEIDGIESMHGLCINIVPTEVQIERKEECLAGIKKIEHSTLNIISYGYESIEDIRRYANLPAKYERRLWSLFLFQNYPTAVDLESMSLVRTYWYSSQPYTIMTFVESSPRVEVTYNEKYFNEMSAKKLLNGYMINIEKILEMHDTECMLM